MLRNTISFSVAILLTLTAMSSESRAVTVDGIVSAGEYSTGFATNIAVESGHGATVAAPTTGEIWLSQNGTDVSIALVQPLDLVDNSYGANAVGWGSNAPSGKNHSFSDLLNSDKLQLSVLDSGGSLLASLGSLELDYLAAVGSGYQAVVVTDPNGKVSAFKSSLDYNLNDPAVANGSTTVGGVNVTQDSPVVTSTTGYPTTVTTAGLGAWEFASIYEFTLSNPGFTVNDLVNGTVSLAGKDGVPPPLFHDSPNKIAKNKVFVTPDFGSPLGGGSPPAVPEPSSLVLLLIGSVGLLTYRVRRRWSPPASISAT